MVNISNFLIIKERCGSILYFDFKVVSQEPKSIIDKLLLFDSLPSYLSYSLFVVVNWNIELFSPFISILSSCSV